MWILKGLFWIEQRIERMWDFEESQQKRNFLEQCMEVVRATQEVVEKLLDLEDYIY